MSAGLDPYHGGFGAPHMSARSVMSAGRSPQDTVEKVVPYVRRTLQVRRGDRPAGERTDADFFAQEGPLVILGDPGMGKSRIAERFAADSPVPATDIWMLAPLRETFPERVVIDGVDEVPICDPRRNERAVVEELRHFKEANFVLTCRAADWKSSIEDLIYQRWKKLPVVGKLLPLDEHGIEQLVRARMQTREDAAEFIKAARKRGVFDVLGNPQHLVMLVDSVEKMGWPDSKTRLYQSFCETLATETNPKRNENTGTTLSSQEDILRCAGFVFAQLLLSGTTKVHPVGGQADTLSIGDIVGDGCDASLMRQCIGTRLFTAGTDGSFRPCHRTVAEYLAARWLSESVKEQRLSEKDVEAVMLASEDLVPSLFRGVHAWFATHCAGVDPYVTDRYIKRDPYGFWCYGDPGRLGDSSAQTLLDRLAMLPKDNPYFYGYEGGVFIGDWPRKGGLQEHVIDLIEDSETPTAMLVLLVDSIKGKDFMGRVDAKLKEIVKDETAPAGARHSCFDCLATRREGVDVDEIVRELVTQSDIQSLAVAVDGIVLHTPKFKGSTIVDVLVAAGSQRHYLAMGQHGVEEQMTVEQLRDGLDAIGRRIVSGEPQAGNREARRWVVRFLGKLLEAGEVLDPSEIWRLLRLSVRDQELEGAWDFESRKYFEEHEHERRTIQGKAIRSFSKFDRLIRLFRLENFGEGLSLGREDLEFHLHSLGDTVQEEDVGLWRDLVMFGSASGYDDVVKTEIEKRSGERNLRDAINDAREFRKKTLDQGGQEKVTPPASSVSEELETYRRQLQGQRAAIRQGKQLKLLVWAAKAYLRLGGLPGIEGDTPCERLESLVGGDMLEDVRLGLMRASKCRGYFKAARELAKCRAANSMAWYEMILNAHCHQQISSGKGLEHLGRDVARSALAAHHLAHWRNPDETHKRVIDTLEKMVYQNETQMKKYIRDITEPMLDAGASGIAGVFLLENKENLSDVAGEIALGWLSKRPDLSDDSFWALLATVTKRLENGEDVKFVRRRVRGNRAPDQASRARLMGAAFALDFAHHQRKLRAFARESRNHLWVFQDALLNLYDQGYHDRLGPDRCEFLLASFALAWPAEGHPGGMLVGNRNPWDATRFLTGVIDALKGDRSPRASEALTRLAKAVPVDGYLDDIKLAKSDQRRLRFETEVSVLGLPQVRRVLLRQAPANHKHLQELVMEKLEELQDRIRGSDTNPGAKYWDERGEKPRLESYCAERIKEDLERIFHGPRDISIVREGLVTNEGRADFLISHKGHEDLSIPVEVKGQWSPELWDAARTQLAGYVEDRRAGQTGIYLVLWFGEVEKYSKYRVNAPKCGPQPDTAEALKMALDDNHQDIPYRLRTFVLDLSGGSKSPRQRRTGIRRQVVVNESSLAVADG